MSVLASPETAAPALAAYPTASAYLATEGARLLLGQADEPRIAPASRAAGEAAYYLSDTFDPDDRLALLAAVESQLARDHCEQPITRALALLGNAGLEVKQLLRGPSASSELRIALRALSQAIGTLAGGRKRPWR